MAILIQHSATITQPIKPKNGHDFTLDEMQAFVGGHIEFVHLDDDMILCINEEGNAGVFCADCHEQLEREC